MNHSYVDPGLGCIGQSFVVPVSSTGQALAQPTAPAEPRECSFDHPSSRQHLKVVAVPGALDNLERPACQGPDPLDQLSSIASIGPDQPHAGKPPYQFIDDQLGSISILDIGRMHHHRQQQPHGIYTLFCEQENTCGYFLLMRGLIQLYGIPIALYTDRHSVFKNVPGSGRAGAPTQFSRAMDELGIQMVFALSPQAKGPARRRDRDRHTREPSGTPAVVKSPGMNSEY